MRKKKTQYKTLNWAEISESAIKSNYAFFLSQNPGDCIIPVLKSNAYGHGLKQIIRILQTIPECSLVGVDSYPEYLQIYLNSGKDILLMNETHSSNYALFDYKRTHICVYTLQTLQTLIRMNKPWKIHIFINTGMNREGFQEKDLPLVASLLKESTCQMVGIMSHFSHADHKEAKMYCSKQLDVFSRSLTHFQDLPKPKYIHINNTNGFLLEKNSLFTAHRIGQGLYGDISPTLYNNQTQHLKMAMSIYTTVVCNQHLGAGDMVGYDGTYTATNDLQTATIPFGYFEGLPRSLSNNRVCTLGEKEFPILGRISMNMASIADSDQKLSPGDTLCLISSDILAPNSRLSMSQKTQRLVRDLRVSISPMVQRRIVK